MVNGALCILDALGFKGMCSRDNIDAVKQKLVQLKESSEKGRTESDGAYWRIESSGRQVDPKIDYLFFSDTVVAAAWDEKVSEK